MNKYSQIFQTPYINTYQAPDINTFARAAGMVRDRYDTNLQNADMLEQGLEQLEAAPFAEDQRMLRELKSDSRKQMEGWASESNYEDMAPAIRKSAKDFARRAAPIQEDKLRWDAYKESVAGLENLSEQQKAQRLALGSRNYTGLTQDENGEWNYFSGDNWNSGVNVPEWTDKVLKGTEFDSYALYSALDEGHIKTDATGRYIVTESGVRESRDAQRIANVLNSAIEGDSAMQGYIADEARIAEATTPQYDELDEAQLADFSKSAAEARKTDEYRGMSDSQIYASMRSQIVNNGVTNNIFGYGQAKYKFSRIKSYNQRVTPEAYKLADYKNNLKSSMGFGVPGSTLKANTEKPPSLNETQAQIRALDIKKQELADENAVFMQTFMADKGDEVNAEMEATGKSQREAAMVVANKYPAYSQFAENLGREDNINAETVSLESLHAQDLAQLRIENPEVFEELDNLGKKYGINDPTNYEEVMAVLETLPEYQEGLSSFEGEAAEAGARAGMAGSFEAQMGLKILSLFGAGAKRTPRTASEAMQVLEVITNDSGTAWYSDRARSAADDAQAVSKVENAYQNYKREHLPPAQISTVSYTDEASIELAQNAGNELLTGNAGQFTAADGNSTGGEQIKSQILDLGNPSDLVVTGSMETGYYSASGSNVVYRVTYTNKTNGKNRTFNVYRNAQSPQERNFVNNLLVKTYGREGVADAMLTQGNQYGVTYETASKLAPKQVLAFQNQEDTYLYKASNDGGVPTYLVVEPANPGDPGTVETLTGTYKPKKLAAKPASLREVLLRNTP